MPAKMLILHGYSDGSGSFEGLREFFVDQAGYRAEDVYLLDYSSMDDDTIFEDFADKLNADYERLFGDEAIDVACHSTGALVVRAWLALRHERAYRRGGRRKKHFKSPVRRLLMFAPANFGSDLAGLGQSFLGKVRATFFNSNSHGEDFLESGKNVLRGLEPASPFQWRLSDLDLHGAHGSHFDGADKAPENSRCYPFVLAASRGYGGVQGKLIKKRKKAGTDGTVRICGCNLNTDYVTIDFRIGKDGNQEMFPVWDRDNPGTLNKYSDIPFAMFEGFNHGSIINPKGKKFLQPDGPGSLALEALKVKNYADYKRVAKKYTTADKSNRSRLKGAASHRFQQFFFKVRDDVNNDVEDYFIDFYVTGPDGVTHSKLTEQFDRQFESEFYVHSSDRACRVMMINCNKVEAFGKALRAAKAKLAFDVTAPGPLPNVRYQSGHVVVFDSSWNIDLIASPFIRPNTTMMVDIVLNREPNDKILAVKDHNLKSSHAAAHTGSRGASGRGQLLDRR